MKADTTKARPLRRLIVAAAVWVFALALPAGADELAPDALARSVTDEVLAIVRADKELQNGNQEKVIQLVESKVLPHFDFAHMTRLAVGRNWRDATPQQQQALVEEFKTLLVRTYTTAYRQYRNETIEYRPLRMAPGDTDVIVRSVVKQPGRPQPIAVDYGMEKLPSGWKVYDVKIEGVSLVENYRSTFASEIQRNGVDGLIRTLSDKNKALAAQQSSRR
jgi:phospholipid transport system substrate-binding protein